jgi:hypothetical protein
MVDRIEAPDHDTDNNPYNVAPGSLYSVLTAVNF